MGPKVLAVGGKYISWSRSEKRMFFQGAGCGSAKRWNFSTRYKWADIQKKTRFTTAVQVLPNSSNWNFFAHIFDLLKLKTGFFFFWFHQSRGWGQGIFSTLCVGFFSWAPKRSFSGPDGEAKKDWEPLYVIGAYASNCIKSPEMTAASVHTLSFFFWPREKGHPEGVEGRMGNIRKMG